MDIQTRATDAGRPGWLRTLTIGRNPKVTLLRAVILVVVILLVRQFVLLPIKVVGISMQPTYFQNQVTFVNCLAYKVGTPRRGDVVAIRYTDTHVMLLKRIVGLPDETIEFRQGRVLINGEPLDEPYVKYSCNWDIAPRKIDWNQYYVVGDNRSMAETDHEKGRTSLEKIVGKVMR